MIVNSSKWHRNFDDYWTFFQNGGSVNKPFLFDSEGLYARSEAFRWCSSHHQGALVAVQVRGRTVFGHVGLLGRFVILFLLFEPVLSDLEDQALQEQTLCKKTPFLIVFYETAHSDLMLCTQTSWAASQNNYLVKLMGRNLKHDLKGCLKDEHQMWINPPLKIVLNKRTIFLMFPKNYNEQLF